MSPLATVIIPTFNYARYIGEALESVLAQGLSECELEIIVVDDGSTDGTADVVRCFGPRVRYLPRANGGKGAATQHGIEAARGRYLFNLDADDFFLPGKLARVLDVFESDSDVAHVGHPALCWAPARDERSVEPVPACLLGRTRPGREALRFLSRRGLLFGSGSTFACRADVFAGRPVPAGVDMFTDEYALVAALLHGATHFIPEPLSVWRIHGSNYSGARASAEADVQRERRLVAGSAALLNALPALAADAELLALYRLKHVVRELVLREREGAKGPRDLVALARASAAVARQSGRHAATALAGYHVPNRLLPSGVVTRARRLRRGHA